MNLFIVVMTLLFMSALLAAMRNLPAVLRIPAWIMAIYITLALSMTM